MKLKLKNTPEQIELVKAMGSRDTTVAREAVEAFAAFIGPVVSKVLMQAGTASAIYSDLPYDEDDNPSIPLDLWHNAGQDYVTVWTQNVAGGLPTSTVEGFSEMKVSTYRLDSAVSFLKRYARRGRLDVVSKAVERMANEVLVKQERNAWAVVLKALAEANSTTAVATGNAAGKHLVTSGSGFDLNALNSLMVLIKRLNTSWAGGSTADTYGLTDIFVSPEVKAQLRSFSWNPMSDNSAPAGKQALPDGVREDIYRAAGVQSLFGVTIHELVELGKGRKYNTLFGNIYNSGSTSTNGPTFGANNEIVIGFDLTKDAFVRPVARNADSGSTFSALPDDQFVTRSEKIGFYGSLEEGRVALDGRAVSGIII